MNRIPLLLGVTALLSLAGCGNDSRDTAAPLASALSYSNPVAAASDWQLMRDATSTSTHLVLNLVGPSDGSKYRGAGFTLQVDNSKVKIARFAPENADDPAEYYKDGGVFFDKQLDPTGVIDIPTTLQAGGVKQDKLMVGIYQKADDQNWNESTYVYGAPFLGTSAKDCFRVILQIAIDFDATLKAKPGDVTLAALKAKVIPEMINTSSNRHLKSVDLKVGTLKLN